VPAARPECRADRVRHYVDPAQQQRARRIVGLDELAGTQPPCAELTGGRAHPRALAFAYSASEMTHQTSLPVIPLRS
jgi:hypothetical protein